MLLTQLASRETLEDETGWWMKGHCTFSKVLPFESAFLLYVLPT